VGKAQEKCTVYRTEKRHNARTRKSYAWIVKSTALVNHYYFSLLSRICGLIPVQVGVPTCDIGLFP
jgi:hypothetical protein